MEARWDGATAAAWRTRWGVPRVLVFDTVGSTNDVLANLAAAGAPAGTIAIADHQSSGRGRLGRPWTTPPGRAILLSALLRPTTADPSHLGTVPLRVGLAVARAADAVAGIRSRIKWPNDLLAPDGAKLAGILCESPAPGTVVAGIGINVLQYEDELPPGATSLRLAARRDVDRAALADALIAELTPLFTRPTTPLDDRDTAELGTRDCLAGRPILVDGQPAGTAAGIARDGSLLTRIDGRTRVIRAGTVRTADRMTSSAGNGGP